MRRFAQNHQFYILVAFLLVMSSCVKEMDFGGVKDIKLEPEMELKLLEFRMTPEEAINVIENETGVVIPMIPMSSTPYPTTPIRIEEPIVLNSKERILEHLVNGVTKDSGEDTPLITFTFTNTINADFKIEIALLDKDGHELIEKEKNGFLTIPAKTTAAIDHKYSYNAEQIKIATAIRIDLSIAPKENLDRNSEGELAINASGIFNFSYDPSEGLP